MANQVNDLTVAERLAVKKAITDTVFKKDKEEFPQGHDVDVNIMVRVAGKVKKGVDTTSLNWPKAKWDILAAVALSNVNEATREKIGREFLALMAEAETAEEKEALAAKESKIKEEAEDWRREVMGKTEVVRKGTVTFKGELEILTHPEDDRLSA
jgi:hypothetical protein